MPAIFEQNRTRSREAASSEYFASQGTYTSCVYDAGRDPVWGQLQWQETLPAGTDVVFQVGASDSQSGPWTYVGPDGTSGTYFSTASGEAIPASVTGRYFRYQATLTASSDLTLAPSFTGVQ